MIDDKIPDTFPQIWSKIMIIFWEDRFLCEAQTNESVESEIEVNTFGELITKSIVDGLCVEGECYSTRSLTSSEDDRSIWSRLDVMRTEIVDAYCRQNQPIRSAFCPNKVLNLERKLAEV